MKLFVCFGGAAAAAAVIDDEAAEVAARHLQAGQRRRRGRLSLLFRGKSFLSGYKGGNGKPSVAPPLADSKKRGMMDADDDVVYDASRASSVASTALLSSASSLDSDTSASSSASSRSSTASSSPSVSGVLYPQPVKRQVTDNNKRTVSSSPVAGAAAVVLCLLMVLLCGRVGATLLTSTALYLFPRRWPSRTTRKEKRGAVDSLECDAASVSEAEEEATAKRKVEGGCARVLSVRNRNE